MSRIIGRGSSSAVTSAVCRCYPSNNNEGQHPCRWVQRLRLKRGRSSPPSTRARKACTPSPGASVTSSPEDDVTPSSSSTPSLFPLPTHCVDGTGYAFSANIAATMERYDNKVPGSLLAKATKMCRDFGDESVKVEIRVEEGDARNVICQVAEKISPHVLVMGNHGYGLIKLTIPGSVSHHCTEHVKCPLLSAKKPQSA